MRRVVVALALGACGRVAFDPLANDAGTDDSDSAMPVCTTPFNDVQLVPALNSAGARLGARPLRRWPDGLLRLQSERRRGALPIDAPVADRPVESAERRYRARRQRGRGRQPDAL